MLRLSKIDKIWVKQLEVTFPIQMTWRNSGEAFEIRGIVQEVVHILRNLFLYYFELEL